MSVAKVFRPVSVMNTERYEPRISRSHCRNLFGPIDHEQLQHELQEELGRIYKEKERRWNFDFINQRPLNGKFIWEKIGDGRTVGFSTIASPTEASFVSEASVTTRSSAAAEENHQGKQSSSSEVNCLKTPERVTTKPTRRSPRITDYLRGRKKSPTSREIKFNGLPGDDTLSAKQVRTSRYHCRGAKQSTLDKYLPKLRPRHTNSKTTS